MRRLHATAVHLCGGNPTLALTPPTELADGEVHAQAGPVHRGPYTPRPDYHAFGDPPSSTPYVRSSSSMVGSHRIVPTAAPALALGQRQLLMDAATVEDSMGCRRVVHQPVRHAANPLLSGGRFAEYADAHGLMAPQVHYDRAAGSFFMWATAYDRYEAPPGSGAADRSYGVYFESSDGITWTAPDLVGAGRQVSPALPEGRFVPRNVFWAVEGRSVHISVCVLPESWPVPGQRFAMLYHCGHLGRDPTTVELPGGGMDIRLAFSADGLRFQDAQCNPVFVGQSDCINSLLWHPGRHVFCLYRRPVTHAGHIRRIAYSESVDLCDWSQPTIILGPDELDTEVHDNGHFYGLAAAVYHGTVIGMLHNFYHSKPFGEGKTNKHLQTDIQLVWSTDAVAFSRHPRRPLFLETGPGGTYDWAQVAPGSILEREDRVDVYYCGLEQLHAPHGGASHICVASLRKVMLQQELSTMSHLVYSRIA
eukprot:SAG22_NODE_1888_length_3374_cov_7.623511_2_plen_478_part_00